MKKEPITNALTGFVHHDKYIGTSDEYLFYTVMDSTVVDGTKLFFDFPEEFSKWQNKNHPGEEYFLVGGINGKEKAMLTLQETGTLPDHL